MITLKYWLNTMAFIITIALASYGFLKGTDVIELSLYNLYFIVIIITLLLNIFEKE